MTTAAKHYADPMKEANTEAKEAVKEFQEASQAFTSAAKTAAEAVKSYAGAAFEEVKDQSEAWGEKALDIVQEKPLMVLGGVALAGFLLGFFVKK